MHDAAALDLRHAEARCGLGRGVDEIDQRLDGARVEHLGETRHLRGGTAPGDHRGRGGAAQPLEVARQQGGTGASETPGPVAGRAVPGERRLGAGRPGASRSVRRERRQRRERREQRERARRAGPLPARPARVAQRGGESTGGSSHLRFRHLESRGSEEGCRQPLRAPASIPIRPSRFSRQGPSLRKSVVSESIVTTRTEPASEETLRASSRRRPARNSTVTFSSKGLPRIRIRLNASPARQVTSTSARGNPISFRISRQIDVKTSFLAPSRPC